MHEEMSTRGHCAINKIFSCISQGTEGMNTLMCKMTKRIAFNQISVQELIVREKTLLHFEHV